MGMTIINNYEMPSNCYICDLHNYHECDLTGESIEEDYCYNGDSREKHCPLREVEAIPKDQYENRLKTDLLAMLTEIQLEIAELPTHVVSNKGSIICMEIAPSAEDVYEIIQEKINKVKENKE